MVNNECVRASTLSSECLPHSIFPGKCVRQGLALKSRSFLPALAEIDCDVGAPFWCIPKCTEEYGKIDEAGYPEDSDMLICRSDMRYPTIVPRTMAVGYL